VLRPLAEQLAALAAPRADETVLELSSGDGELNARLRGTAGAAAGTVVVIAPSRHLPFDDNAFDLAVSLLAIDAGDGLPATLSELARVAGRAHVVVWGNGATHENALRDAWRDLGGDDAATAVADAPPLPPEWTRSTLTDVARFDGINQLWQAMITERGVTVSAGQEQALRERLQHHVAKYTAADGTMRIPVRAALLSLR